MAALAYQDLLLLSDRVEFLDQEKEQEEELAVLQANFPA